MKSIPILVAGAALCGVCSLAVAQARLDPMCGVIDSFAEDIAAGEKRSMELETKYGGDNILPSKSCRPSAMDAKGRAVCEWTQNAYQAHLFLDRRGLAEPGA
ncbi:hypothetical protein F2P45_32700 [Massilia sp. CCM 8733]|uniref:Uncharacterized protein n=1 Tax=Massilia mucilaginosa TaxID=2609282 RepID=A0ABX0P330_9BURK|nr:hypothetical protein [Massilia mucilaginosa]NHZ93723.1 hypothetical protein [Massilia mucilaginosa]